MDSITFVHITLFIVMNSKFIQDNFLSYEIKTNYEIETNPYSLRVN